MRRVITNPHNLGLSIMDQVSQPSIHNLTETLHERTTIMNAQTASNTGTMNQDSYIDALDPSAHISTGMHAIAQQEHEGERGEASGKEPTAFHKLVEAIRGYMADERGMSTIEYALGCVAAAALGALLYTVVTSDTVEQALSGIFEKALQQGNRR
ncbi:hypothetical protein HMPREF3098_07145 [Corynebacterium sp. HMSC28B08]|nr:hypothetical protein HMPREF3098_07145 [Corynebacterium sp. HMSC28B08]